MHGELHARRDNRCAERKWRTRDRIQRGNRHVRHNCRSCRETLGRVRKDERVSEPDPDLLIDFTDVLIRRSGNVLVGTVTWQVDLDEKWVVLGPNGAGKTSLLRIAAAQVHPTSGIAHLLGEVLGRVDVS